MDFSQQKSEFNALDLIGSGWHHIAEDDQHLLTQQLRLEISHGHILYDRPLEIIVRRYDQDDVLLIVSHSEFQYAKVHLTWVTSPEHNSAWPAIVTYRNLHELIDIELISDEN